MRLTSNSSQKSLLKKYPTFLLCTLFLLTGVFMGWKNIPGTLKANFVLLSNTEIWSALSEKNKLDTIHLDVSFKNIQKIENKRKVALKNNRKYQILMTLLKLNLPIMETYTLLRSDLKVTCLIIGQTRKFP